MDTPLATRRLLRKPSVLLLRQQFENLRYSRTGLDQSWDLVLRLVQPNYKLNAYFQSIGGQQKLNEGSYSVLRNLYHNRGAVNSAILASYLHSNLTNPHADWMKINLVDDFILENPQLSDQELFNIRDTQNLSRACHYEWQSGNLHSALYPYYKNLVDLGTSCLVRYFVQKGRRKELIFNNVSMFNIFFMEDNYNRPNHVFCVYNWTAFQIRKQFYSQWSDAELWKHIPAPLLDCYMKRDLTNFSVIHSVMPEGDKYKSCYFYYSNLGVTPHDDRSEKFLKEELINYNPYNISRIRRNPESVYGTGFSMEAYPLLAALQSMQSNSWLAADKNVNPPMNVPSNRAIRAGNFATAPNTFNPVGTQQGKVMGLTPTIPQIKLADLVMNKESLLRDIDQTYLIDKIIMESVKSNRSATEVQKRTGEEIKILSPFIGSLESEFLRPLVELTLSFFKESKDRRKIQDILNRLSGQSIRLQYISPIAQVQIQSQVNKAIEFFGITNAFSQLDKKVMLRQNFLALWEKLAMLSNVPFDTLNQISSVQEGIRQIQQDAMREKQIAGAAAIKIQEHFLKMCLQE